MAHARSVGIDIGTYNIKVAVAEGGAHSPRIIGRGVSQSRGMRHGYIINTSDAARSIRQALTEAEESSGEQIKEAYISVGGIGLSSTKASGSVIVSRADSEISDFDLQKVLEAAENNIPPSEALNRKILHSIPLEYRIDGKPVLGSPVGMKGVKLEVQSLFITTLENHLSDIIEAVEETGIEVIDVSAAPIAASLVTLTKLQKLAGCVLANIGAETLSIVVFENNLPLSLEVFPIGATDITHDIALGLKIPIEEAEQVKLGAMTATSFPEKKIDEIINKRIQDMLHLIEAHLKKIGKNGLLPAGIILTGGGSEIHHIETIAKEALQLPAQLADREREKNSLKNASWAVAYGLCILGVTSAADRPRRSLGFVGRIPRALGEWFKQFLP